MARPSDPALVSDQAASRLAPSGFDPSRITEAVERIDHSHLQPIVRRAAEQFYAEVMHTSEDWLRDNVEHNLKAHLAMLEHENAQMRKELWEVDQTIGGTPNPGHDGRIKAIAALEQMSIERVTLIMAVSKHYPGETRYETALRYIRERDSDGSGEAGETGTGSTEGDSAGPKDIAQLAARSTTQDADNARRGNGVA